MTRKITIILHLLFIILFLLFLREHYQGIGSDQKVDNRFIIVHDEITIEPILLVCLVSELLTVVYLVWGIKRDSLWVNSFIIKPVSFLYSIFNVGFGFFLFIVFSSIAVMGAFTSGIEFLILLLFLLSAIGYVVAGILTFKMILNKKL